jgi:penicillin amidase
LRAFFAKLDGISPGASNNWAVAGEHSFNGRPLLAGDPHQGLESPSRMWAHHLNSYDAGGTFDAVGFSFVGSPGIQLGHSRWLGWTATTSYPDVMDMWDVEVTGAEVSFAGQKLPITIRQEEVLVRDGAPVVVAAEEVPGVGVLLPTDLSPVPLVGAGHRMLLGWPGLQPTREAEVFVAMNDAHTIDAFEAAVDRMEIGNFNFIVASAEGIAYRSGAAVPDRGAVDDARAPFKLRDGSDPAAAWVGLLGPDKLPKSRAAARGWIASANNDPFGFTADGRIAGDPWYYGWFFDPGTRAGRVEQELARLTAAGPVGVADMQALQLDSHSVLADVVLPVLDQAWAAVPTDDALAAFRDRPDLDLLVTTLLGWDRQMTRAQAAPVPFTVWMWFLAQRTLVDDLPVLFEAVAEQSPIYALKVMAMTVAERYPAAPELMQEGRDLLVMQALDDAAAFLTGRFGSSDPSAYTWADLHVTRFVGLWGPALEGGTVPTDGSSGTVNVSDAVFLQGGEPLAQLESHGGAIYRMVVSFDDDGVPRATVSYPRGNAGDPDSPFWDNTLEGWVEGEYRTLAFRGGEVAADVREEIVLSP